MVRNGICDEEYTCSFAQRIMLPVVPFLVHSLFTVGGCLLRGGVVSCDCFLTIAGKTMIIYSGFHRTSVMNNEWSLIRSRGPELCMQYGFDGRTGGLLPYWSRFHEVESWWVTQRTQNPTHDTQTDSSTTNVNQTPTSHFCFHTQSFTHHVQTNVQSCCGNVIVKPENQWPTVNPFWRS